MTASRAPAWFVSHGGPTTGDDTKHPIYSVWQDIGKDLVRAGSKGVVVVSAHWESEEDQLLVNTDPNNPLVYDFYGFPAKYYQAKFQTRNPPAFSAHVQKTLLDHGLKSRGEERGPDHGVWVFMKAALRNKAEGGKEDGLPDSVPLCQVSLPRSTSPSASLRLGRALRSLRDEGITVIGGGQAVHNLRDFRAYMTSGPGAPFPDYAKTFSADLTTALQAPLDADDEDVDAIVGPESNDPKRWDAVKQIVHHTLYLRAHPTPEHLSPVFVALGAAFKDEQTQVLLERPEGPLSWNVYRWG